MDKRALPGLLRVVAAVAAAWLLHGAPPAEAQTLRRYQWKRVQGAVYYAGRLQIGAKIIRFRSPEPFLVTSEGELIGVRAVNANGHRTRRLPISSEAVQPPKEAALIGEPGEQAQAAAAASTQATTAGAPEDDTWVHFPPSNKTLSRLGIGFGLGVQSLDAKSGVSKFEASNPVGATLIEGVHQAAGSPWFVDGQVLMHSFSVEVKEADTASGGTAVKETSLFQAMARGGANYDWLADSRERLFSTGIGFAYVRSPALEISDNTNKTAALSERSVWALYLALGYDWIREGDAVIGGSVWIAPFALNSATSGQFYGMQLHYSHLVLPSMTVDAILTHRSERLKYEQDCENVANCSGNSSTSMGVTQLMFGGAYRF